MLVGNAGCGKTALVRGKLRSLGDDFMYTTINLNYYTDSMAMQNAMEIPLEKKVLACLMYQCSHVIVYRRVATMVHQVQSE